MTVLQSIPNGAQMSDVRETFNALLVNVQTLQAQLAALSAGGGTPTPSPTPAPTFTQQPTVSPNGGTSGVTTFTATPGSVTNGTISSRAWLLNGTSISTGLTATPQAAGTLTYQEYASGSGGNGSSAVVSVTVASTPAPSPTGDGPTTANPNYSKPSLIPNGSVVSYPPDLSVDPGANKIYVQAGDTIRLRASNTYPISTSTGALVGDATHVITDAEGTAAHVGSGTSIADLLAQYTSGQPFFIVRFENSIGYGPWSDALAWGDVTPPTLSSGATATQPEDQPMAWNFVFSEPVNLQLTGGDAGLLEKVTQGPATTIQYRLAGNVNLDFETKASYSVTGVATDLAGNPTNISATFTVQDLDENPDGLTFPAMSGQAPGSTVTGATVPITGLAPGISVPASATGGVKLSKNGAPFTTSALTVMNGDTLAPQVVAASTAGGNAGGAITVGGVTVNWSVSTSGPDVQALYSGYFAGPAYGSGTTVLGTVASVPQGKVVVLTRADCDSTCTGMTLGGIAGQRVVTNPDAATAWEETWEFNMPAAQTNAALAVAHTETGIVFKNCQVIVAAITGPTGSVLSSAMIKWAYHGDVSPGSITAPSGGLIVVLGVVQAGGSFTPGVLTFGPDSNGNVVGKILGSGAAVSPTYAGAVGYSTLVALAYA
ncbi:cadherin repeat domain-containing protein [uncultured Sphingomonas sp.]|uniref:cadherin repeat domain-containing protein n=1 Tax=uncultured Sphingomonas sp. TaxID=158754 RepID=UPI002598C434|nr:cadherin repeat domain-containing protein [uncultured Sphingomonas sp.]